jgi:hypothetical protein
MESIFKMESIWSPFSESEQMESLESLQTAQNAPNGPKWHILPQNSPNGPLDQPASQPAWLAPSQPKKNLYA